MAAVRSAVTLVASHDNDQMSVKIRDLVMKVSWLRPVGHVLEYPQFLTPETRHVPDSIGQDAFSKVK